MTSPETFAKHIQALPKRVRVGAYTYTIERVPQDTPGLDGDDGSTLHQEHRILLDETLSLQRLLNVVLHECQHCIDSVYNIEDGVAEEKVAECTANGWQALYIDNIKLHNWINRSIRLLRASCKSKI